MVFYEKLWFSRGSHLDTDNPFLTLSDWAENFFGDTYGYISEVVLSFFKNLTFFFVGKKNTERFFGKPVSWHSEPYKSGWKRQKLKRPILPLEDTSTYLW